MQRFLITVRSHSLGLKPYANSDASSALFLEDAPVWFDQLAGAAGLATLAWQ
jgi:hypothetical protein